MTFSLPRLQAEVPIVGPNGTPGQAFLRWWNQLCGAVEAAETALGITDDNVGGVQAQNRLVSNAPFALVAPDANFTQARVLQAGTGIALDVSTGGLLIIGLAAAQKGYTVASLPSASANAYARFVVSNANSTTFGAVVAGGGSNVVPVYSDGAAWRIG